MADNVGYTPGAGATIAADDIAGVLHQRVKLGFGADGAYTDASESDPLPVSTGGLTDAQLRASAVPVSGTVTANTGLSQPLTDAQLRADAVPVTIESPAFMRVAFSEVGSGLQGNAATYLTVKNTGSGMAISQSAGNLVITTGTTANAETVIRSVSSFSGSLFARAKSILSQRIANNTFRLELADLVGEGLSYTINSTTSVTVTFPTGTNPFTSINVGQFMRLSCITGAAGIPGRYAIASVSGDTVTYTVASWPASGSGTLTVYGWNYMKTEYSGTTATNALFDCQRRGWASGDTTATINTTASPGHVGQLAFDVHTVGYSDALVASNTGYAWTARASRIENIPDVDVPLYLFIIAQNGTTNPASTTTWTMGFIQVEDQGRAKVRIASADPVSTHAMPVQVIGSASVAVTLTSTRIAPNAADGHSSTHHAISAASTNATSVKASAGSIGMIAVSNINAAARYFKLYNKASAPTVGTDTPILTLLLKPGETTFVDANSPIRCSTGIAYALTTGMAVADTAAVAATEHSVSIFYT